MSTLISGKTALHFFTATGALAIFMFVLFGCGPLSEIPGSPLSIAEKQSIILAADRLLQLQNLNGSWDWDVTGQVGPTAITYRNIAGTTGEGLLCAFSVSGDVKYLDGAIKTGDYLILQMGYPIDISKGPNSANVLFLYHLYEASGEVKYKTEADAVMNNILYEDNYFAHNLGNHAMDDGIIGCTAAELFLSLKVYRSAESTITGIVAWDVYQYVENSIYFGDTSGFGTDMAEIVKQYVEQPGYTPTTPVYILGLSGGVMAMQKAGFNYTVILNNLLSAQKANGSWKDDNGIVQDTAFAIMALMDAGKKIEAKNGVQFLLAQQEINGGWLENDGREYSEVDSEIIQAINSN